MATSEDRVRVNVTISAPVHNYLLRRAALTGGTVAGVVNDMVVKSMFEESEMLPHLERATAPIEKDQ